MNEQKNCPFLILLLLSVILLTVIGSLDPDVGEDGGRGLAVSYGGSGAHSIEDGIGRLRAAFAEGRSFPQSYEEELNRSLPVARVFHAVKNGGLFPDARTQIQAAAVGNAGTAGAVTETDTVAVADAADAPDTAAVPDTATVPDTAALPAAQDSTAIPDPSAASDLPAASTAAGQNMPPVFGTVGQDYFDDAVFIGDSRIVGLKLYSGWENATFLAARGMEVYSFFTKKYVDLGSGKMTVPEALAGRRFGKVYLMLGINELGAGDQDTFVEKYREILEAIRELQPDALIYVMGILRVDEKKSVSDPVFNNENIGERNRRLKLLAQEMGLLYIDVNEVSCDENGFIPEEYTGDGVHLKAKYLSLWTDYLLTHAATPPSGAPGEGLEGTAASAE